MSSQLTSNAEALRLFFTEDVYLIKQEVSTAAPSSEQEVEIRSGLSVTPTTPDNTKSITSEVQNSSETITAQPLTFEHLGKNQKGILILVNDNANKVSTPQGTELLRKLVKAIELTNNDFALVNYASYTNAKFDDLKSYFNCKIVLSFGVDPQQLGMSTYLPNHLHVHEACQLVFTKNLHDLEFDPSSKKALWASLQQLR